jgi:hypothetical protein
MGEFLSKDEANIYFAKKCCDPDTYLNELRSLRAEKVFPGKKLILLDSDACLVEIYTCLAIRLGELGLFIELRVGSSGKTIKVSHVPIRLSAGVFVSVPSRTGVDRTIQVTNSGSYFESVAAAVIIKTRHAVGSGVCEQLYGKETLFSVIGQEEGNKMLTKVNYKKESRHEFEKGRSIHGGQHSRSGNDGGLQERNRDKSQCGGEKGSGTRSHPGFRNPLRG